MITNSYLKELSKKIHNEIEYYIQKENYELALKCIEFDAHIQYQYCFNDSLFDEFLENKLSAISKLLLNDIDLLGKNNKVLFFDSFGFDNRGLTQQYLEAFALNKKDLVFIFESDNRQYSNKEIVDQLNKMEAKIYYLKGNSRIQKAKELFDIICKELPEKIYMHLTPWSTIAYLAFDRIKKIERIQINLTDHTFWLGVNILDKIIEFRSYGINLSQQKRNINPTKLYLLPYFPIMKFENKFQGWPINTKNKIVFFAGGTLYKVLGDNLEFLKFINSILKLDENILFFLAGSGNTKSIEEFIKSNNLENRFILLGDRLDINELVYNCNFYIATFPFAGALMNQIAVANDKYIINYQKENYGFNNIDELFFNESPYIKSDNLNELLNWIKINYKNKSNNLGIKNNIISPELFSQSMLKIENCSNPFLYLFKYKNIDKDYNNLNKALIENENNYNPLFKNIAKIQLTEDLINKYIPEIRIEMMENIKNQSLLLYYKTIIYYLYKSIRTTLCNYLKKLY